jgi:D-glycero-alpha-D-manno-heptose-7-phosphate kinase
MIIARAPVRISFAGGGTDLPAYFMEHGGAVVSTTIDKFVYVVLTVHARPDLQILSSDYRTFFRHTGGEVLFWEGDLNLPKAILHEFGIEGGASMFLASEVPPGTGLGSSSTVTVASLKAVSAACGRSMTKMELAETATHIEVEKLGMPIGYQDQFAAAFGGLNYFEFRRRRNKAEPLRVAQQTIDGLRAASSSLHRAGARLDSDPRPAERERQETRGRCTRRAPRRAGDGGADAPLS